MAFLGHMPPLPLPMASFKSPSEPSRFSCCPWSQSQCFGPLPWPGLQSSGASLPGRGHRCKRGRAEGPGNPGCRRNTGLELAEPPAPPQASVVVPGPPSYLQLDKAEGPFPLSLRSPSFPVSLTLPLPLPPPPCCTLLLSFVSDSTFLSASWTV